MKDQNAKPGLPPKAIRRRSNISRRAFLGTSALGAGASLLPALSSADTSRSSSATPRLTNVNTGDIKDAIALGCRAMQNCFNADDNHVPFFGSSIKPRQSSEETRFSDSAGSHVPGRHLNALLNAEEVAGVSIDERAIENHSRAMFLAYSGPLKLSSFRSSNRRKMAGPVDSFSPHNCREGFHALYSLVKYRKDEKARRLAEIAIEEFFKYWNPDRGWDYKRIQALGMVTFGDPLNPADFILGAARAVGPLVKYYRATGYGRAIELALLIKEKAIEEYFREDGEYDPKRFGTHTHSVTCSMSSLAQLADLTKDSTLLARVRAFYDNGLWKMRDQIGWVWENFNHNPARGEINNTGDIVETALILGRWGYTRYFEDAERMLRCHLLPSQLRDNSFIIDPPNPGGEDAKRSVADRHLGTWGFPAPYGHWPIGREMISFNLDIVGGAVGSLCEVLREATRLDESGHWVNLLFDHETEAIRVESPYTHPHLRVQVKMRTAPLWVRIPSWVNRDTIRIEGIKAPLRFTNGYLFIASAPIGRSITIAFPLPRRELVLKHRTRNIRVRLRGDEVVAMDNFGADLTFFEPYEL